MLAHKAKVPNVTPRSFRRQPFGNSIMGECAPPGLCSWAQLKCQN
jgi:hypothetical protein